MKMITQNSDGVLAMDDRDFLRMFNAMFHLASKFSIEYSRTIGDDRLNYDVETELPNLAANIDDEAQLNRAAYYMTYGYVDEGGDPQLNGFITSVFNFDTQLKQAMFSNKVMTAAPWIFDTEKIRKRLN